MTIIAALDNSAAARPVLDTALTLGLLLGTEVEVLHVRDGHAGTAEQVAGAADVPVRAVGGEPVGAILDALAPDDVLLAVLGARRAPGGRRPVGNTALHVVERATKAVVVVPPESRSDRPLRRILVPLDGRPATADAVRPVLAALGDASVEIVALHVFGESTAPRFLDRPERDIDLWAEEFLARYCDNPRSRFVWRAGAPGASVVEAATAEDVGLITMSWSRDSSAGHAAVVQEVLARSPVPVALLPAEPSTRAQAQQPA